MSDRIIVMRGLGRIDLVVLQTVAGEFGWSVDIAGELREIAEAQTSGKAVAVLVHCDALGPQLSWYEVLRVVRCALPEVHVVACLGFSESIDWPGLYGAGAFHALWLPLKENEVRQCLGFVWEAEKRRAGRGRCLPAIVTPARDRA